MREYRFRGKTKATGEWVYGYYFLDEQHDKPRHCIWTRESVGDFIANDVVEVDPETVGQYTGLHDKEYKMIYEGDIIKNRYGIGKVVYKDRCFVTEGNFSFFFEWPDEYFDECSVIGNIHDNPELLEVPDA